MIVIDFSGFILWIYKTSYYTNILSALDFQGLLNCIRKNAKYFFEKGLFLTGPWPKGRRENID